MRDVDVVIIGAGAAGLMCAIEAGKRHRRVLVLEKSNRPGKKILMSGGGRCNFTNYNILPTCYLSHNPHFCKSALKRYTQWDFISFVKKHAIPFHEKTQGQLFCDHKSSDILNALLRECAETQVDVVTNANIECIKKTEQGFFNVKCNGDEIQAASLVVASGGLSIPTLGGSGMGYDIARQFGISVYPTEPALVPFILSSCDLERYADLSGVSQSAHVSNARAQFSDQLLFTHRGLSGPSILQLSSYWEGEPIQITLLPELDLLDALKSAKQMSPKQEVKTVLKRYFPSRLVDVFLKAWAAPKKMAEYHFSELERIAAEFQRWVIQPVGTEGYRTAEVTRGGVDCDAISSKTMETKGVSGLFFIGEVLDVTGWLGGYNFQWAWSSGWAAGQVV